MKVVIDTNVFISGIFWSGPPEKILKAWETQKFILALSPEILDEYKRVSEILAEKYPTIDLLPFMDLLTIHAEIHTSIMLPEQICRDPDDDKFIAAALSANANIIISGDKDLLIINNFAGTQILKPKIFCDLYLSNI